MGKAGHNHLLVAMPGAAIKASRRQLWHAPFEERQTWQTAAVLQDMLTDSSLASHMGSRSNQKGYLDISDGLVCMVWPRISPVSCGSHSRHLFPLFQSRANKPVSPGFSKIASSVKEACVWAESPRILSTHQPNKSPTADCPASNP